MRKILGVVFFLIAALPAAAQGGFTTVTGTITGPDGIVWACGTISAQLITAGGAAPTLNGGGFTTQTSPVGLGCPTNPGSGANGSFAMRLADSGVISPSNTTWKFTVNMAPGIAPPAGTGPQSFTFGNQFTGAALESTVLPSCPTTTGLGTGSCATANTQGNNAFDLVLSPTGAPGSTGTVTINYAGTNQINTGVLPSLTCDLADGTGAWGSTSVVKVSTRSATVPVVTWTNSVLGVATALTAGSTYVISCQTQAN